MHNKKQKKRLLKIGMETKNRESKNCYVEHLWLVESVRCVILNVKRQGKDTEPFVKGEKECG